MCALHDAAGVPVSRMTLSEVVFRRPFRIGDRGTDTIIKKLRRKIEANPDDPQVLKSVRPTGYVFVGFPTDREA